MFNTNKRKYILGLVIILAFLIVIAIPLILQNNQTAFTPQPNTLTSIQAPNVVTSKANPQPQPNLWWNYTYTFRQEINVTEPGYTDRVNAPASVYMNFLDGNCNKNSTKLTYYNSTTASWVKLPSQISNATYYGDGYLRSCDLLFPVNVTKSGTSTYYLYYNSTFGAPEPEPSNLSITVTSSSTFSFSTGVISGYYQSYSADLTYDNDASFQSFQINGVETIPTSGVHKGIDRIDADDNGRFGLGNTLNWTINVIENGPIRAIVTISKTSTDIFTVGGSYGPMNKTYTFYAYTGIVAIQIQNCTPFSINSNAVPIYDFAVTSVDSSWNFYVDNNNLGIATSIPFVEAKAGTQPQNYMALVRNDGIGLGFLGSSQWPRDTANSTSMEYGTGFDSGVSSFGVRNDMRNSGEHFIQIPFQYYIVGLTGGVSQAANTWNQVNHNVTCVSGNEIRKIFPLQVNVTDNFGNPILGVNVTVYNDYNSGAPTGYNTSGLTNSLDKSLSHYTRALTQASTGYRHT